MEVAPLQSRCAFTLRAIESRSHVSCAWRAGTEVSPMAIMQAAAPEVLLAAESSKPTVTAAAGTDIWALGVVAFEVRHLSNSIIKNPSN
jgi:hypothetical protein